jgi:hypothetical protein
MKAEISANDVLVGCHGCQVYCYLRSECDQRHVQQKKTGSVQFVRANWVKFRCGTLLAANG